MNDDPFSPDQPTPTPPFAVRPVGTGTPTGARPPPSSANRPKRRHAAGAGPQVTGAASVLAFGGLAGVIGISAHQATTTKSKTVATTATTAATESSTTAHHGLDDRLHGLGRVERRDHGHHHAVDHSHHASSDVEPWQLSSASVPWAATPT